MNHAAIVGEFVTVGHGAIGHGCMIDDEVLIGMGAIVLDGAEIGACSIVGANALVTAGTKIPPGSMVSFATKAEQGERLCKPLPGCRPGLPVQQDVLHRAWVRMMKR